MDHSSEWSSQQTVRGVEAKCQLDPSVRPVTLQHKWITMLEPSRTTDHDTTTSTSTTALTSTPAPSTAAAPPPPPTAAAAPSSAEGPSTAATRPSVAAEAYFVGRKRALGEEGPIIILTQHEEDEGQGQSEQPDLEARSTSKLKKQEPTLILAPQPDEARSQLSTGSTPSDRGREPERRAGRAGYPPSDVSPKRDVSHVMQFFQEQEESLQASFLSLPKRSQKKQRSPSPHHMAGLEHLDHLIRLMEQLTSLKDENLRLRKRCEYLESTKVLLQAKRDLSFESSSSSSGLITAQTKHKHKHSHRHEQTTHTSQLDATQLMGVSQLLEAGGRTNRPRLASAEELEYLELIDTTSDHRPKHRSSLHKRSFSTGSLHVESDHLTQVSSSDSRKRLKSKTARSIFSKTSASKQKSKSSKWARVKKVLTGQKLYEDLGTTIKSIREMGRPSHGRYSTTDVPTSPRDTSPRITNGDRRHSGASFARGTRGARAPPAQAPPSEVSRCSDLEEADLTSDLTSDIWMGPPDWWEEYEARKESGTSTASEVSSVIEVTTMYLGSKKEAVTTTLIPASTAPPASPSATGDHYLTVDKSLPRRQSSPSLSTKEGAEEEGDVVDELARTTEVRVTLHKSSSCKSADLEFSRLSDFSPSEGRQSKKLHKTAWGRVKDIIHTRKDSIRKRPKRSGIESEEPSEFDLEALMEERWHSQAFGEGLVGRSTPKTSPIVARQQSTKCDSPPGAVPKTSFSRGRQASTGHGAVDVAALLAGSVSEEFSKKMQQWETMRSQKSPFRASMDESDIGSMEVSGTSQDFNIRTVNLGDLKGKIPDSEGPTPEESNTSMEVLGAHSIHMEDIQRGMTDSFSRKMEEWERLKYKSISGARDVSPEIERKMSKSRKEERQKSKRSREEKEREKWERQRERDMQKVEREQMKLEKEKLRLEKERLRALEREAKLEKLKGRLSQSEGDSSFKNPVLSPLAEYKVTADFARKLHEWELKKGLCHDVSNSIYLEAQKLSSRLRTEDAASQSEVRPAGGRKAPPPLTLQPYWDSPEESSPIEKYSEASVGDGDDETSTSVTEEGFTRSNIATLERANAQLLETLHRKELEYASVQEEVQKVNEKLAKAKEEHAAEMARFHRELASGTLTGPVKLEVGDLQTSMGELEEKIKLMENFGEKLAMSMESAAVGKWQSIEGEETVHTQLVELVDQMRTMLLHATQSEEDSQKTMALSNFETLYSQAMKLQVQMNNLRLSHLERNREIMGIKRQLLLQEVNNLLLQADISRRETELCQFQEAKTFSSLKRWKTFGGSDRHRPQAMMELPSSSMVRSATEREPKPYSTDSSRLNIPYIAEELTPVTSSSISAPASPSALAGDAPSVQLHSTPRSRPEQATDHTETHLQTPPTSGPCRQLSPKAPRFLPPKRSEDTTKLPQSAKASPHSVRPAEGSKPSTETLSSTQLKPTSARSLSDSSKDVARTKTVSVDERRAQFQIRKPEFQTICDSAPLHEEIQQLRKAKSEVEQGSPTLTQRPGSASAPSPEAGPGPGQPPESPTQVIPVQQSLAALRAQSSVTFPAVSVMECTDIPPRVETITDSDQGSSGGSSLHTRSALTRTSELPPISDHSKIGSKVARSPLSKHKLLRRQREERETKLREYQAISPKGSPVATRGKPPLPKQSMPIKQSPTSSPAPEKGPRSKSVGDMDRGVSDSTPSKPLQDAINRFEKRATVCETEDRPIELRKTPSPTLHLPRVGLVSRVRRLKPAAELLEESQRYRSGHSIYATRIMQKYLPKPDPAKPSPNKENVSYVHAMVSRLSRDNTPVRSAGSSRTNSDLSLQRTDSPRTHSEFVTQIVRKLSTPSGSDGQKNMAPFKDLTNEGIVKKLAETFSHPAKSSPERAFSDSGIDRQRGSPSALKTQHRKSCEVAMVLSTSPASDISYQMISSMSSDEGGSLKPESQPGPSSHQSLPILPSTERTSESRSRAATYCVSDIEKKKQEEAEGSEIEVLPPSSPKSDSSSGKKHKERSRKTSSEKKEEKSRLQSSLSPERRGAGRGKMGTVGVLCKQSISFDLGVSLYGQASKAAESPGKSRQARSWDPSESSQAAARAEVPSASGGYTRTSSPPELGAEARPQSTSSEGEAPPSSPSADEKKKRRFLDSAWLQKSKKFFKVSK